MGFSSCLIKLFFYHYIYWYHFFFFVFLEKLALKNFGFENRLLNLLYLLRYLIFGLLWGIGLDKFFNESRKSIHLFDYKNFFYLFLPLFILGIFTSLFENSIIFFISNHYSIFNYFNYNIAAFMVGNASGLILLRCFK